MRAEVCQLDLEPLGLCLFPFQPSWRLFLWFQREIGISKNKAPPVLTSLNINREVTSTNTHSLVPNSARATSGYATKGETCFPYGGFSWLPCTGHIVPHSIHYSASNQTRQHRRCSLSVRSFLAVERSCDGAALMRSY